MTIYEILEELNLENGSNYKKSILEKHKDNEILQRVLKMTYDKVSYTFNVTMKNVDINKRSIDQTLENALDILEFSLCTRKVTGNAALELLGYYLSSLSDEDSDVIQKIIGRDLKIRLGRTEINKVFPKLIVKPPYTRCEIGTKANILKNMPVDKDGNFKNKVFSQEKMDGTFRATTVSGDISILSRPGFESEFPIIKQEFESLDANGYVFIGEMTLRGEKDRQKGNGIINSDDIPHEDVLYTVWDMIPVDEYKMDKAQIKAAEKAGTLSKYEDRLEMLENLLKNHIGNIQLIQYRIVKNMKEAYEHFQEITKNGGEGSVIKAHDMTHKDGNSKKQLKVKLVIDLEMRFTTYNEGNKGSKNEDYFSGINFENDEGTIKGTIGVTSMTELQRDWFHVNRDTVQNSIFTVICNDITKGRDNDYYALSHPRYEEIRTDKDITDTLERSLEIKEMAMNLK